ncbi:MAG: hypothetical protein J7521_05915 [Caulobacter sp.]|nr:hypothetical protein [Caulobacter sp.]
MYIETLDQLVSLAFLVICCGVALWRGGRVERIAATTMILAWFATPLVQNVHQQLGPQSGVLIVDVMLLVVLLIQALTSNRWWPMVATAFQGVNATVHLAAAVDSQIFPRAYYVAGSLLSDLTLATLLIGALNRGQGARATLEKVP